MTALMKFSLFSQACYSNGEWVKVGNAGSIEVRNPATAEVVAQVPSFDETQLHDTITAAAKAFGEWAGLAAKARADCLHRLALLMREEQEQLAYIMVTEQGKPITEARAEVHYAADYFQWFAEEAVRNYGDVIPAAAPSQTVLAYKEPVGVCACITPWNFPLAMLARKAGAALAAGCTVVAKPSSLTPLSAFALAKLAAQAGIPAGVFNVITGESQVIGKKLCEDPRINKLSFTGSTAVGRTLASQCASDLKKVSLELGGNAPFIVFDDAVLDDALAGLMAAKFRNNGQTCVCVNRLFIQESVYSVFVAQLRNAMAELTIGDGFAESTEQTVLINDDAVTKFNQHVKDALAQGGELVLGGTADSKVAKPTLITGGHTRMRHCQEETFAPLLVAIPFNDEAEVVRLANDTPYGLAAYFYARDLGRIQRVSRALQAGMVGVNAAAISNVAAPFGGVKHSGYGREGSKYGLDDYVQCKYVLLDY